MLPEIFLVKCENKEQVQTLFNTYKLRPHTLLGAYDKTTYVRVSANGYKMLGVSEWDKATLPTLTYEEWETNKKEKEKEMEILPEKWCIFVTKENADEVLGVYNNFLNTTFYTKSSYVGTFMHSHNLGNGKSLFLEKPDFYFSSDINKSPIIDLETFRKIVKKNTMKERKIIGYKAPMDLFKGAVKAGSIYKKSPLTLALYTTDDSTSHNLPSEIVEQWEPVYEEIIKEEKVNLGSPARAFTITSKEVRMETNGSMYSASEEDLDVLIKGLSSSYYTLKNGIECVFSVQVGCEQGTRLKKSDLEYIKEKMSWLQSLEK